MIHELVGIRDNTAVLTSAKVPEQYRWEGCFLVGVCSSVWRYSQQMG
jgi:hypothetical protein